MTDNEIRTAIDEARGYNIQKHQTGGVLYYLDKQGQRMASLLNYAKDLNAMHEAVQCLKAKPLLDSGGNRCQPNLTYYDEYLHLLKFNEGTDGAIDATARQRAEAFLRAIGKWKDV